MGEEEEGEAGDGDAPALVPRPVGRPPKGKSEREGVGWGDWGARARGLLPRARRHTTLDRGH